MKATRWLPIVMCLPLVAVRGHDVHFATGGSALCIPFEASNRHIAFQARLNDRDGMRVVPFKVIFDYPHRRMILEPGPDVALPFEADMSGLGLVSVPPDFRRVSVARVLGDSPALEAGVQAGDEIDTVDGKSVGDIGLPALRERLRLDGQELRLEVLRGTDRIKLELRTRRMI